MVADLKKREISLERIIESAPFPFSYWNQLEINIFINKASIDCFQKDNINIEGKHFSEFLGEELYSISLPYIKSVLSGVLVNFSYDMKQDEGSICRFKICLIPDLEKDQVIGFFMQIFDITENFNNQVNLKSFVELYKHEKNNFNSFFEAFDKTTILAKTDSTGIMTYVNEKFCEISSYTSDELIGQNHRLIKSGVHSKEFYQELWQTIKSNKVWHGEICNKRKDGSYYWVDCTIVPITNSSDLVTQFISVRFDISQKKETERSLLVNSKLITLGEAAANIAHEINNPLAFLLGKLKLLERKVNEETVETKELAGEFSKLHAAAKRIEKIILGLKAFSRLEIDDPFVPIQFQKIIDDTSEMTEDRLKKNNIECVFDFQNPIEFECRPTQISQILLILINNSIDAINNDPVKWIKINAETQNNQIIISVSDSGQKIPTHIAQKLMTPLFTTKAVGKGTGLGLNVAKKLAEIHHGKFYLDREKEYNTFVIELPLKQVK